VAAGDEETHRNGGPSVQNVDLRIAMHRERISSRAGFGTMLSGN
jgi:hypothetical protein